MRNELKILLLCNHLNVFGYSLFGPLYSLFVLEVGGSAFHAGASWALYTLAAGVLMFIFSRLEDQVFAYRKRMIVWGYFILAFGALAFTMVRIPAHIYIVQAVNALGIGMVGPAWKAVYSKDEERGKEAEEWALSDGGANILIAIAAFLGGLYITHFSFRSLFFVIFLIQVAAALLSLKLLGGKKTK